MQITHGLFGEVAQNLQHVETYYLRGERGPHVLLFLEYTGRPVFAHLLSFFFSFRFLFLVSIIAQRPRGHGAASSDPWRHKIRRDCGAGGVTVWETDNEKKPRFSPQTSWSWGRSPSRSRAFYLCFICLGSHRMKNSTGPKSGEWTQSPLTSRVLGSDHLSRPISRCRTRRQCFASDLLLQPGQASGLAAPVWRDLPREGGQASPERAPASALAVDQHGLWAHQCARSPSPQSPPCYLVKKDSVFTHGG